MRVEAEPKPNSEAAVEDIPFMQAALALARRGLGVVWPNPAVGCLLVREGIVVGRGWTQPRGRPHAETEALVRAGNRSLGATAYVNLEPCNHHGETGPCTEALIASGIRRAVVAVQDPDQRVSGRGIERLKEAGIAVSLGVCKGAATDLNSGFFLKVTQSRPLFTLKVATTLDGRIATRSGESQWITGAAARAMAHRLRADHDAVLIGSGTALADDPSLNCRLPGMLNRSPVRIVVDGRLRLTPAMKLIETAGQIATWVVTSPASDSERRQALEACGAVVIEVEGDVYGHPVPDAVAAVLAERGLTRVLIEGGGGVSASYLAAGLVDRVAWFRAPRLIGGDGVPVADALGVESLSEALSFRRMSVAEVGEDVLETYGRLR